MDYEVILYQKANGVAHITLNRPEKLNALSAQLRAEVMDAIRESGLDEEVNAIIIKGAGRAFSAGADLTASRAPQPDGAPRQRPTVRQDLDNLLTGLESTSRMWNSRKPVIGQIHGYCLAAATDFILHADILICAENTQFGFPPVRAMGTPPTHMWTYLVGPQWAKYMLFTGNSIDGKTAERIGLVLKAVPADELEEEANHLAETIAKVPYGLLAVHKRIVNYAIEMMGRNVVQQVAAEGDAIGHIEPSNIEFGRIAATQGIKAALEWRDGKFGDYRASQASREARGEQA